MDVVRWSFCDRVTGHMVLTSNPLNILFTFIGNERSEVTESVQGPEDPPPPSCPIFLLTHVVSGSVDSEFVTSLLLTAGGGYPGGGAGGGGERVLGGGGKMRTTLDCASENALR